MGESDTAGFGTFGTGGGGGASIAPVFVAPQTTPFLDNYISSSSHM